MVPDAVNLSLVKRALVIKLRHHGDVLLTSPVFTALKARAPSIEIDALVYADTRDMLAGHPAISQLHEVGREWKRQGFLRVQFPGEFRLFNALRSRNYDLIIHLTDHYRGAWLTQLLRPRYAVAPKRSGALWKRCFTHLYGVPHHVQRHTVELNLDALRRVGIYPEATERHLTLAIPQDSKERIASLQSVHGISRKHYIVIHPTSRWLFKMWPEERVAALIDKLQGEGHRVVITSAPSTREKAIVHRIVEHMNTRAIDLSGQFNLKELGALIGDAALFIGVDSAPMHIAAAMGTPTVALFGPSGEKTWGPWMVAHRIVASDHACRPCGQDGCGGGKVSDCLVQLPVSRVHAAATDLLHHHG